MEMKAAKKQNKAPYFRVVTNATAGKAEMFLYGYIGNDLWWDDDNEESITDLAFIRAFRELEKEYSEIHLRINSPGGSVYHGDPIITAIRASKATIHTWNDGLAASMAADIWVAGDKRHMSENAKLMIHATSSLAWGTAKEMRDTADMLDKFDDVAAEMLASALKITKEDVQSMFYDYSDHWLTAKDALELGLIDGIEKYKTEAVDNGAEKMGYAQLVRSFQKDSLVLSLDERSLSAIEAIAGGSAKKLRPYDKEHPEAAGGTDDTVADKEEKVTSSLGSGNGSLTVVEAWAKLLKY